MHLQLHDYSWGWCFTGVFVFTSLTSESWQSTTVFTLKINNIILVSYVASAAQGDEEQSRSQSPRSPWPALGKRELKEQPFQACAIDVDCAMGRIRLFPLLFQNGSSQSSRFPSAGQGERRLWERDWMKKWTNLKPFKITTLLASLAWWYKWLLL